MTLTISSLNCRRLVYRSSKSICLPTVFSASENLAAKSCSSVASSEARAQPMDWATLRTSSRVLFTRTKKATLMSARMLSAQISPSLPRRSMSTVFREISITSARWMMGSTTPPVKVTMGSDLSVLMMSTRPCSTCR